ncbi:hypothetical protein IWX90DRAFT_4281 [Phyllosticta citrichinensis]|uniref:Transmembrane protein n=1 Tax=Phyllosticta citrichinensis TaxID=1130410 RepID=A0ABR1Y687_9PEZI
MQKLQLLESSNTHVEPRTSSDQPVNRDFFRCVRAWYFFALHIIVVITFGLLAVFQLNGKSFPLDSPGLSIAHNIYYGKLRQSDVTTLIAAALVVARFTTNVCNATAAQRCVFILLEKCGITLRQIERLFCYEQGPAGFGLYSLGATLLLLLFIPAQLSAPVAQGAISWRPKTLFDPADFNVTVNTADEGLKFNQFRNSSDVRGFSKYRASGLAVLHGFAGDFYSVRGGNDVPSRRWISAMKEHGKVNASGEYQALPRETKVGKAVFPFFHMTNLTWIDYQDSFTPYLDMDNGLFNVSSSANPLAKSLIGNAAILRNAPSSTWLSTWPNATILDEGYTIAVVASQASDGVCANTSPAFGPLPLMKQYLDASNDPNNCYLFARVEVTAGSLECSNCQVVAPGVVERPGDAPGDFALQEDSLLDIVLGMLPETMLAIVTANATYAPTWENLEGFLAGSFSAAYQASWNDLVDRLATGGSTSNISLPYPEMEAVVDTGRIQTWIILHLLILVAGTILFAMQWQCEQPAVIDFAAVSLLTDAGSVLRSNGAAGIRTASSISGTESKRVGKLVMRQQGSSELAARHRVLKKVNETEDDLRSWRVSTQRRSYSELTLLQEQGSSRQSTWSQSDGYQRVRQ